MGESLQKAFFGVIALGVSCIAIELIPVSRQAAYWNSCVDIALERIDEERKYKRQDKQTKLGIAVSVCNGAVYEPKVKFK